MTQLDRVDNSLCADGRHIFAEQRGQDPASVGWGAVLRTSAWGLLLIAAACVITAVYSTPKVVATILAIVVVTMVACFVRNLVRGHRVGCAAKRAVRTVLCAYKGASTLR
ncbi:hypothetical protein [Embleya sp. MST-111070]|uniref:hypothetical protein n=1 Tax=Embleya sp. MST-111070 TaxID=3398231 RepID=UPI003F731494